MANIKILGSAAVVTSGVKVKVLETLRKFKPNALKLVDAETKEEYFKVQMGSTPSFTKHGAVFTGKNEAGLAQITVQLPEGLENEKKAEYVKENFGYALLNLNKLEAQVTAVMETTEGEFAAMEDSIEIL